jgi:hypothetical protein
MNKEEIQKRIAEVELQINETISKAIMLTRDQIHNLDMAYAEMEHLQFQLRSLDTDGSK